MAHGSSYFIFLKKIKKGSPQLPHNLLEHQQQANTCHEQQRVGRPPVAVAGGPRPRSSGNLACLRRRCRRRRCRRRRCRCVLLQAVRGPRTARHVPCDAGPLVAPSPGLRLTPCLPVEHERLRRLRALKFPVHTPLNFPCRIRNVHVAEHGKVQLVLPHVSLVRLVPAHPTRRLLSDVLRSRLVLFKPLQRRRDVPRKRSDVICERHVVQERHGVAEVVLLERLLRLEDRHRHPGCPHEHPKAAHRCLSPIGGEKVPVRHICVPVDEAAVVDEATTERVHVGVGQPLQHGVELEGGRPRMLRLQRGNHLRQQCLARLVVRHRILPLRVDHRRVEQRRVLRTRQHRREDPRKRHAVVPRDGPPLQLLEREVPPVWKVLAQLPQLEPRQREVVRLVRRCVAVLCNRVPREFR
eukprot:Rhum_TRINITY_DN15344_c6_g4::Rhum_TRINITY_DN15344_c6_g4_i6::g.153425::m.153425